MNASIDKLPVPGLLWGTYPERRNNAQNKGRALSWLQTWADHLELPETRKAKRFVTQVHTQQAAILQLSPDEFKVEINLLRSSLQRDGFSDQHLAKAFALLNQALHRTLGIQLFDTQLIAARIILKNRLAEMATGEGKTIAVALAAATAALAGVPVHVITANDYLAQRDADGLRMFYNDLDISVDAAIQGQSEERRHQAYACNITYCTAKELVFDYLRDGLQRERNPLRWRAEQLSGTPKATSLLRGLCMAIVDEADSILIDEARVPLILSANTRDNQEKLHYSQAITLAHALNPELDYILDTEHLQARLTNAGREKLESIVHKMEPVWHNRLHREETVCQALAGLHLYQRDRHYLVHEGKILIIDENTGRIAEGRAWSRGLHQIIEMKEGCKLSSALNTLSQITYQRLFPRYLRLGGVSGTLKESRRELFGTYGLRVNTVPLRSPCKRTVYPTRLFNDQQSLWQNLAERISELQSLGRPVLVGTESVADSETLSRILSNASIRHEVLNARHDEAEASIIAKAGIPGTVTITTNMAGRGTDISLGDGVTESGGLHVISCQINASKRIDRQLAGRCARQGDPGSVETWVSLQTTLLRKRLPRWIKSALLQNSYFSSAGTANFLIQLVQKMEERQHVLQRRKMLAKEKHMEHHLSFGVHHD